MPSRSDQLQSSRFGAQRVQSALVAHRGDPTRPMFANVLGAGVVGVLATALAVGGLAAYGLVNPGGSTRWQDQGAVVVERETGARYIYRDGRLHPVLNYTSAVLAVGRPSPPTVLVARGSLADAARGPAIGIPGAPDSLPPAARLGQGAWTVCSQPTASGPARSVLYLPADPGAGTGAVTVPGGRVLAPGPTGAPGVLVSTDDGTRYLITGQRRHLIRAPEQVLARLVWMTPPAPVAAALINALPAGADLVTPTLAGRGQSVSRPPGGRVGQVYAVRRADGDRDYFVALADGLASVTAMQKELLLADPHLSALVRSGDPTELSLADFAPLGASVRPFEPEVAAALPAAPPTLVPTLTGGLCVAGTGAGGPVQIRVDPPPAAEVSTEAGAGGATGSGRVDRVVVRPGSAVLVAAASAPDAEGAVSLVTDLGIRYPVPRPEVLAMLGYAGRAPAALPAALVAAIAAGPTLDPDTAQRAVA